VTYLLTVFAVTNMALLIRILARQTTAVRVARDTKSDASDAAHDARAAASAAQAVLDRVESLAGVVANDLESGHHRAAAVSGEPGAAADAAARTHDTPTSL